MDLVCPVCKRTLDNKDTNLICEKCKKIYDIVDGIPNFLGGNNFYWGEVSPGEMENVLKIASEQGYHVALENVAHKYPELEYYLLSNTRIDWLFHCYSPDNNFKCLDIGSGWGSLTFPLSKFYKEVWSLEGVWQRINFQKIRKNQEGIKNIHFIRGDMFNLPFPQNYFDLIVANGVLEWMGLMDHAKNPRDIQLNFLKEIRRVLKPGGCLYIGIENRFGIQFFFGYTDHSGLPFTSLLPRKLADLSIKFFRRTKRIYSRNRRISDEWEDYRTYTYTKNGYDSLLNDAGFKQTEIYWCHPSYNYPQFSAKISDVESLIFFLRFIWSNKNEYLSRRGRNLVLFSLFTVLLCPKFISRFFLSFFANEFLIFTYKDKKKRSLQSDLLEEYKNCSFIKVSGKDNVASKLKYFILNKKADVHKVAFSPRFETNLNSMEIEHNLLKKYGGIDSEKKNHFFIQNRIKGDPLDIYDLQQNLKAIEWLCKFQNSAICGIWSYSQLETEILSLAKFIKEQTIEKEIISEIEVSLKCFMDLLRNITVNKTAEHGDFWSKNIFIDSENLYVIDWEDFRSDGNPLFDFGFFIISNSSLCLEYIDSFHENMIGKGKYSQIQKTVIRRFSEKREIPPEVLKHSITYTIIRTINRNSHQSATGWSKNYQVYLDLLRTWSKICNNKSEGIIWQ